MYIFTNIFREVRTVRNSSDLNISTFSIQHSHPIFLLLLLLSAAMRIDTKYITSLYLSSYCIRRLHEVLYALIGMAKAEAETKAMKAEKAMWRPPQQKSTLFTEQT